MSGSEKNSKILQKHQHVTSKHNTEHSKTQTQWKTFCFNDTNDQMTQTKQKKTKTKTKKTKKRKEMADQSSKKRLFSKLTLEFSHQLTI